MRRRLRPTGRVRTNEKGKGMVVISIVLVVLPLIGAAVGIDAQSKRASRHYRALAARIGQA